MSLIILSKSKADYDRESQIRVLQGLNGTITENYEISHLMKKSKTISFRNLTFYKGNQHKKNFNKNNSIDHNKTNNFSKSIINDHLTVSNITNTKK